ncbi:MULTISPECIES: diaminopimelate decarboxylase [Parabacteroides]|jgi:diaminopimelate decarboxylase|uniref:Diaminopimelate decarboxylase n=4 Tax=Parabacteroides goldsteinii TaxID=328812 RepID=A0A6G1Z8E6_9BACT|nr:MULTISPECIES: diaminopimelate decarboxylase [Parabacteroides]EOS17389.1 diaminopimelate decarboxylase [Parabacteroides goldsteinii dnLKV18]KAI4359959.1 Diaminopimelate decarboxylase [Parabacteroides sp. ASF519]MBF0763217.1 diaminopimelate decarboxylase [Parabacteroides goldsteinii]MDZ3928579.1 diaminopimelate decarboxylase [Parabacteroides goldsteinii]MRX90857.1 diaminopimelate decarboxylase [Parabacteroides goldsteinii]
MLKGTFPIDKLKALPTPFYYYDVKLLQDTLDMVKNEAGKYGYHAHYAVKANANPRILSIIAENGLGADCVSGGEVKAALDAGFPADKIVFAGVGKADWEINLGLDNDIFCFNVESAVELEIIDELAAARNKVASVALRINPEVDAHTHAKITTGMKENKFGINLSQLGQVLDNLANLKNVKLIGIHFHIGSQITDMSAFRNLVIRVNEIQEDLEARGIRIENVNFGGGLGIDYYHPNHLPIPAFDNYFAVFNKLLKVRPGQQVHFEPGRSVVAQCGTLISKVLYVKEGETKKFAILDAGFTELIRPAMYDAYHRIENISSDEEVELYDVVGPICESSDVFGKDVELNKAHRGDLIALRSAGAYGEVMASQYNCRQLPKAYYSDTI